MARRQSNVTAKTKDRLIGVILVCACLLVTGRSLSADQCKCSDGAGNVINCPASTINYTVESCKGTPTCQIAALSGKPMSPTVVRSLPIKTGFVAMDWLMPSQWHKPNPGLIPIWSSTTLTRAPTWFVERSTHPVIQLRPRALMWDYGKLTSDSGGTNLGGMSPPP